MTCKFVKHSIFLSIGNWIKMRYTDTTEYYSDIKKNEILLLAAKWMALENTIFSEISQRQIYDITYMWNIKNNMTRNGHIFVFSISNTFGTP